MKKKQVNENTGDNLYGQWKCEKHWSASLQLSMHCHVLYCLYFQVSSGKTKKLIIFEIVVLVHAKQKNIGNFTWFDLNVTLQPHSIQCLKGVKQK